MRTPPQSSLQSSSVIFTPPKTKDLRTEPFPTSIDIFFWWIGCAWNGPQNDIRFSEPAKLTTWRRENAYEPLQILPLPSNKLIGAAARPGVDCSLVLAPAPIVSASVIDLRGPEIGTVPHPVSSLPIRRPISPSQRRDGVATATVAATANKSGKQEAITRTFRLFDDELGDVPTRTALVQIKETVSFDLDKVTEFHL